MPLILALDQGTTSSRAILFDDAGAIRAQAQRPVEQIFPRPAWVEHDPNEIWSTQIDVANEALAKAGVVGRDLAAIGITNQRETTLVWNRRTAEPLCNAIVWQDRRTAPHCERLADDGLGPLIQRKTGLVIDAYFSATKIAWILEHIDGARHRAEAGELAFGTVDSWLVWKLTGGRLHATDATNASRTMLFDIHTGEWDDELLELFQVPRSMLPDVRPSSCLYAETTKLTGPAGVPIGGVAGDQQAALFGQACFERGLAKNTYGTGCFLLLNTGTDAVPSQHRLLTTIAHRADERTEYALEGSVFVAGAVVQWLRDGLGVIADSAEIEQLARSVEDNGGVYFVPAFVGLGAPHWDPHARGVIVGLTRGTTAGHIARAALESIAFQSADILELMQQDAGLELNQLRVDGGAARNDLLMQFQADILGVPLVRPTVTETTALGAAYLAGLAVGVWNSTAELASQWRAERRFEPAISRDQVMHLRGRWRAALDRSTNWEPA